MRQGNQLLNTDGDLGHHLAMGRLILASSAIPQTDPFSFRTETILAIPHEWLIQAGFATLENWFGLTGIAIFCALTLAATFSLLLHHSIQRSGMLLAGLTMTSLALAASALHWIARPHLLTFLLLTIWSARLEAYLNGKHRRWWIFPLLMLVWANLHGMFLFGLLLLGLSAAGYGWERFAEKKPGPPPGLGRGLALAGVTSTIVTFMTPSGWHLWQTIFELANSSFITGMTSEYQSANFHEPGTWPFLLMLGIILATAVLSSKKLEMPSALYLAAWTLIGLYSARNIPLAAIGLAPIGAELLADWINHNTLLKRLALFSQGLERIEKQLRGWLWAILGVGLGLALAAAGFNLDLSGKPYQFLPTVFPVAAVDWLETNPPSGRMFNEFDWGGYLLYRLWPEQKIFMDGHTHIYGDILSREYVAVLESRPGWETILGKYEISWAILHTASPLATQLTETGWTIAYQDEIAVILRR